MADRKILCRTLNQPEGGKGTQIDDWKFTVLEAAICAYFKDSSNQPIGFMDLVKALRPYLKPEQLGHMGSVGWFATTVILELEFQGRLVAEKVRGKKMLMLAR